METETPAESITVDEAENQSFLSFKFGALIDLEKSVIFQQLRTRLWTIWTRGETEAPAIRSRRQSHEPQLPNPPRGVGCERVAAPVFLAIGITRRRFASTILDGDASSLTNGKAERLETNTSMPHMTGATLSGPGEPRVRIPVKRFLACPSTFTDSPDHAGVSCTIRDIACGRTSLRPRRFAQ